MRSRRRSTWSSRWTWCGTRAFRRRASESQYLMVMGLAARSTARSARRRRRGHRGSRASRSTGLEAAMLLWADGGVQDFGSGRSNAGVVAMVKKVLPAKVAATRRRPEEGTASVARSALVSAALGNRQARAGRTTNGHVRASRMPVIRGSRSRRAIPTDCHCRVSRPGIPCCTRELQLKVLGFDGTDVFC